MNKEIFERWKDRWISIGVDHFYKPGILFYHSGILQECGDEQLVIQKNNGDIVAIAYNRIKEFQASGIGAYGN